MGAIAGIGFILLQFVVVIDLTFTAIYLVLVYPFKRRYMRELRQKSREEIERMAFAFETEYFNYIGPQQPAVVEFRDLTTRRDLPTLRKQWGRLRRAFRKLERIAGHRGRPRIMDYYDWYELVLDELAKRNRQGP